MKEFHATSEIKFFLPKIGNFTYKIVEEILHIFYSVHLTIEISNNFNTLNIKYEIFTQMDFILLWMFLNFH